MSEIPPVPPSKLPSHEYSKTTDKKPNLKKYFNIFKKALQLLAGYKSVVDEKKASSLKGRISQKPNQEEPQAAKDVAKKII